MAEPPRLLVAIHDVAPPLLAKVERLWRLCADRKVTPGLLVVPDWHGAAPIEKDASFVSWVRSRAAEGAEIFLHGERHDEVGLPRGVFDELRAFGRTNGEGEFLTLHYSAARGKIDRGIARLRALGLAPIGFVPPAWLAREHTHRAAADAGLRVSEDDRAVYVHAVGTGGAAASRRIPSPVVRWSARGTVRAWGSLLQAQLRWKFQRGAELMRIALHPADLDHPATTGSIARTLDAWLAVRSAGGYAAL